MCQCHQARLWGAAYYCAGLPHTCMLSTIIVAGKGVVGLGGPGQPPPTATFLQAGQGIEMPVVGLTCQHGHHAAQQLHTAGCLLAGRPPPRSSNHLSNPQYPIPQQ